MPAKKHAEDKDLTAPRPSRSLRQRATAGRDLLARSKLSADQIDLVIQCYAACMPTKKAMAVCGLSHITIYRIYNLIRQRLIDVGLYETLEQLKERLEGYSYNDMQQRWDKILKRIEIDLGDYRGVRAGNRHLYSAEILFRQTTSLPLNAVTHLMRFAVKLGGPLNSKLKPVDRRRFLVEHMRVKFIMIHGSDNFNLTNRQLDKLPSFPESTMSFKEIFEILRAKGFEIPPDWEVEST